jgi:hypothetical protein
VSINPIIQSRTRFINHAQTPTRDSMKALLVTSKIINVTALTTVRWLARPASGAPHLGLSQRYASVLYRPIYFEVVTEFIFLETLIHFKNAWSV